MRPQDLIKLVLLVFTLLAVLFLIFRLQTTGLGDGLSLTMGIEPEPVKVAGGPTEPLDWCETRVKKLEIPGGPVVFQEKLKWYREAAPSLELDFIAVEKWFGRNCRVLVERLPSEGFDASTARVALGVEFIKGPSREFLVSPEGAFRWRDRVFRSEELLRAINDLNALPRAAGSP